ncbi:MAG: DUF2959 family protein [Planctomycetes bacterium]|nr:DUF2959 family protein [Planctomycetota bacterium]
MQLRSLVWSVPAVACLTACSSLSGFNGFGKSKDEGLGQVDALLAAVERVQVEALVSKERSHAAYGSLQAIVGPDFDGDAAAAHGELVQSIDASKEQGKKLAATVAPLKETSNEVFERWTADLEAFGNTKLRQQSQLRMEETRTRCDAVLRAATAAQLAYDAFNMDLGDHALFLQHDFNAASVAAIASAVEGLEFQEQELDHRLDACAVAAKSYVQAAALRGEVVADQTQKPAETAKVAPKTSTLRRRPAAAAPAPVEPAPAPVQPEAAPKPVEGSN